MAIPLLITTRALFRFATLSSLYLSLLMYEGRQKIKGAWSKEIPGDSEASQNATYNSLPGPDGNTVALPSDGFTFFNENGLAKVTSSEKAFLRGSLKNTYKVCKVKFQPPFVFLTSDHKSPLEIDRYPPPVAGLLVIWRQRGEKHHLCLSHDNGMTRIQWSHMLSLGLKNDIVPFKLPRLETMLAIARSCHLTTHVTFYNDTFIFEVMRRDPQKYKQWVQHWPNRFVGLAVKLHYHNGLIRLPVIPQDVLDMSSPQSELGELYGREFVTSPVPVENSSNIESVPFVVKCLGQRLLAPKFSDCSTEGIKWQAIYAVSRPSPASLYLCFGPPRTVHLSATQQAYIELHTFLGEVTNDMGKQILEGTCPETVECSTPPQALESPRRVPNTFRGMKAKLMRKARRSQQALRKSSSRIDDTTGPSTRRHEQGSVGPVQQQKGKSGTRRGGRKTGSVG